MPSPRSSKGSKLGRPRRTAPIAERSALSRVLTLHARLSNERSLNCSRIAEELGVSPRTILRDIELLRDQMGAPVVWDPSTRTYFYEGPCELLPLLRLEADEALALALASETFATWQGQPLGRALRQALEKIGRVMGGGITLTAGPLRASIVMSETNSVAAERERRHFAALLHAQQRRFVVELTYRKPTASAAPEPPRLVHPLNLACLDHRWALIAYDRKSDEIRTFVLTRIEAAVELPERFTPPPDFDVETFLRGSMGRFTGKDEIEVRIVFDAAIAGYVAETPWHASQTLTARPDGRVEATYRVNTLIAMRRQVLACGGQATVLSPPELREAVAEAAASLLAGHGATPP